MKRKSSIHFKPVANVRFAVSHSERTDLSEPAYLLPKEHQLDNIVATGSLSENDLSALFIQQKEGMTGQAKARGSSPFWEGVVVLPNTDGQEQSANLQAWKKEYEKATGHKVLHMSVHLDEGYLDALGKPQYNPHAHVIVSRMDGKNRVISLDRKQLAKVQDLTAETLQMERGSTLAERQGKRGRAHVPHREFRAQADEKRLELDKPKADLVRLQKLSKQWSDSDMAKVKNLQSKLDGEPARLAAALESQEAQYRLDREALKASGTARQADYQALKKANDEEIATLKTQLKTALEKLAKAETEAAKVPQLEATVTLKTAEINRLTPVAAQVPDLKTKLAEAQQQAGKVPELVATVASQAAQITQQTAAFDKLKAEALTVIKPLREEVKNMKTQIDQLEAAKLEADKTRFADMAKAYQDGKAAGIAAHLIVPGTTPVPSSIKPAVLTPTPIPREATKAAVERPKQPQAPIPSPKPEKSLVERLGASIKAMLEWITGNGGKCIEIDTQHSEHHGAVVQLDDLHAVQRTGRGLFAIHQLDHLDNVPARDDPKMIIRYKDGKGTVEGRLGKSGVER